MSRPRSNCLKAPADKAGMTNALNTSKTSTSAIVGPEAMAPSLRTPADFRNGGACYESFAAIADHPGRAIVRWMGLRVLQPRRLREPNGHSGRDSVNRPAVDAILGLAVAGHTSAVTKLGSQSAAPIRGLLAL